jgi:hypothetical protein
LKVRKSPAPRNALSPFSEPAHHPPPDLLVLTP